MFGSSSLRDRHQLHMLGMAILQVASSQQPAASSQQPATAAAAAVSAHPDNVCSPTKASTRLEYSRYIQVPFESSRPDKLVLNTQAKLE